MKRKLVTIGIFVLALMLLVCGCGSAQQEEIPQEEIPQEEEIPPQDIESSVLYWGGVTDIFDPMGYAEQGYFEMTQEEILTTHPELRLYPQKTLSYDDPPIILEDLEVCDYWGLEWMAGDGGISYAKLFIFEEDQLKRIIYEYGFYKEDDANEYFLRLCERMREITECPRWEGEWKYDYLDIADDGTHANAIDIHKEVPIAEVAESLKNDDEIRLYKYAIDMENAYYEEWMEEFDSNSIKKNARWISGFEDAKVIRITYEDREDWTGPIQPLILVKLEVER